MTEDIQPRREDTPQTLVMKFGGTSVGTPEAMLQVVHIVRQSLTDWPRLVVVTSALSGVTNLLLDSAANAARGNVDSLPAAEHALRQKHHAIADRLISDLHLAPV
jgi:bifunctional aspartokinase / homoserine dehydrogenase 1